MKLYFKNAENIADGIALLSNDLGIETCGEQNADVTVDVSYAEDNEKILKVSLKDNKANIFYGNGKARFFRGLAILVKWIKDGESDKKLTERPLFKTNGAMVDMSRNAVMNVKTVKTMLRKMALMGLNTYMLYTEDTYEIEEYPYFGHLRGRYTKNEIRELDAYAQKLGIELIPCIQMLGHLATHLRWAAASPYKDATNTLLVGADATYDLIEAMLRTIADCFTSRRIHVGMDETMDLGTGNYLKKNGYRDRQDIYFEHLTKVIELCKKHGFEPMMWSDMFFRLAGEGIKGYYDYHPDVKFTDEVKAKIPKGIQQVFWDYYRPSEEFYTVNIDKHYDVFGKDILFAGGVWLWSGPCPLFSRSLKFTIPALTACKNRGVEEIFATIWLNGADCSLIFGLLGLAWYADFDYKGEYDPESVKECFKYSCGDVNYDEILNCERPERPEHPRDKQLLSLTRAFLLNDPLLGIVDKHFEGYETHNYFKGVTELLLSQKGDKGVFEPAYDTVLKLSSLLENKADFGVRLKAAYDASDKAAIEAMADECDIIIEKIKALRQSHKASWMEYNKPFGWEVHDIRYGGLLTRFDTVKERLSAYLDGSLERIEELEAPRLRIDGVLDDGSAPRFPSSFLWTVYQTVSTAGRL